VGACTLEVAVAFSADAVANWFLDRASEVGRSLTPMKLQKLMYFAHGWHLALRDAPLVNESVQAWDYGPVFPSTYHEFKDLGDKQIDRRAYSVDYHDQQIWMIQPSVADEAMKLDDEPNKVLVLLNRVWEIYSPHSASVLSKKTHEVGSPWWTVRKKAMEKLAHVPRGLNIPNPLIRDYFLKSRKTVD
jgi:uncharacterized phage-associated protein